METIEQIGSDTTFHRGFGTIGTKVDLVDVSDVDTIGGGCPRCNESEMVASIELNPEEHDRIALYCTNLSCPHFVADEVEYDMNRIRAVNPERWDNTAICPECDSRFTTMLKREMRDEHEYVDSHGKSHGVVSDVLCEECDPHE